METIMKDMSALSVGSKKKFMAFSDIVGSDIDGKFKDSLTY